MDLTDEEARKFEPDQLFNEELQRRHELERITQEGAEVIVELQTRGPLYLYVMSRRDQAQDALRQLVEIDPKDAPGIAVLQVRVSEYIAACNWIHLTLAKTEEADNIIRQEQQFAEAPPVD